MTVTVAVIGATGTVGPCVVTSLHARGADVRVLTRDAERAKSILAPGIEIRPVDGFWRWSGSTTT